MHWVSLVRMMPLNPNVMYTQ